MDSNPIVVCKHYNKEMQHPHRTVGGPTTSLSCHLNEFCKARRNNLGPMDSFIANTMSVDVPSEISNEYITELVLKFLISGNISFKQADNEYLQQIIGLIKFGISDTPAQCPSRRVVQSRLTSYAGDAFNNLHDLLLANDSKISLGLDCWSSRSNHGFMGTVSL